MMKHSEIQLLLADYRGLRGAERRAVDTHVTTCPACAARLAEYQAMDVDLQSLRAARPTPALRAGYYAAIQGENPPQSARPAASRNKRVYAFASVAAVLLAIVAAWVLLRPSGAGIGRPGVGRSTAQEPIPSAKSAEVGSFIWQTDGAYGYEMLRPAGWSMSDPGILRGYSWPMTYTHGSTLELVVANLKARSDRGDADGALRELVSRFDAAPNLADWSASAEEMWAKYGPAIIRIAEVEDAVIFGQPVIDPTSHTQSTFIALAVKEGQPLVLALNAGGEDPSLEALKNKGIWEDFLTMINSIRPIPPDVNRVEPWAPTATPTPDAPLPAVTAAPTAVPVFTPVAAPTPDPRLTISPDWEEIERQLSQAALGPLLANRVCDWIVLGRDDRSVYVWAYCAAYQGAPEFTAASVPAVITLTDDGTGVTTQIPRDGTYYGEDIRAMFPPTIQAIIFDRTFEPMLSQLERHALMRLRWMDLPPMGAAETVAANPDAPATSATVRIFSGRPDPTWSLTLQELVELDRLVSALTPAECAALPDNLGYRGLSVGLGTLGMEQAGQLVAANGVVQSGDAGPGQDAICLSDPERTVERFLLSSAQANMNDDALQTVIAQLQQPIPTPLVTPSPTPALPDGWAHDAIEHLDIQFAHPQAWEIGTKTDWSRVYQTRTDAPGENPVEPPPFWFTVLPPGFRNEDASAYNWWSDEELAAAWQIPVGGMVVSAHAPEGHNVYTRLPDTTVDGFPTAILNNPITWEAPQGTQERRALVKIGGSTVMFGAYYQTEEQLQTFEQVLASVKFGSLMLARGAAAITPTPTR